MKSQKKPLLGIIQGRLSPPIRGQYQAFPKEWRKEFELAAKLGISYIEWLIKDFCYDFNPLWSEQGRSEILKVSKATGVKINHI